MGPGGLDALKQGSGNRRAVSNKAQGLHVQLLNYIVVTGSANQSSAIHSQADDQPPSGDPSAENQERTLIWIDHY